MRTAGLAVLVLASTAGPAGAAGATASPASPPAPAGARPSPFGAAPELPAGARVTGPERQAATLHVIVALHPSDPVGLHRLATQVATPGSAQFRHFLRPGQVQRRFGASPAAIAAVRSWLRSQHLATGRTLGDGLLQPVTGSVRRLEAAFRVRIDRVRLAGGQPAHANRQAPELPARLHHWVAGIIGLDNLRQVHPATVPGAASASGPASGFAASSGPVPGPRACRAARATRHVYTAAWLANAYKFNPLYRHGDFGQHVTVALFEQADYADRDIRAYSRCYRIHPSVRRVRVNGGTSVAASGTGVLEVTADIEVTAAMAPRANILVYEGPASGGDQSRLATYGAIAQQDRAQVVSSSWGGCEPGVRADVLGIEAQIFQEMAVQGQSMMAAAGDTGSEGCLPPGGAKVPPGRAFYSLQVGDPASQPFVTAVGGTEITRFGSPPTQRAWNQTPGGQGFRAPFNGRRGHPPRSPGNLVGSGGISQVWWMPPWQTGFDRSGNARSAPCHGPRGRYCREVPDVSALAASGSPSLRGYVLYGTAGAFHGTGWVTAGGTSLATPLWAALTALADQQLASHRLGLLSPSLYPIDRADPEAFTDVRSGNNDYLARDGRYSNHTCRYAGKRRQPCYGAGRGYDMATGLGTPQASYLIRDLLLERGGLG